ncbi:uncharacterized protein LOC123006760 isoform X2 [Tribolium madens]|uniref:uncharacterized protein LOC123006760 isoform X2 n=1 Tax=Tribolium madens TaxID=41895 RepID=UPI001CF74114|nr:uncharacterized protein LOC123006760 isoform X2 [Tribolium madens]
MSWKQPKQSEEQNEPHMQQQDISQEHIRRWNETMRAQKPVPGPSTSTSAAASFLPAITFNALNVLFISHTMKLSRSTSEPGRLTPRNM